MVQVPAKPTVRVIASEEQPDGEMVEILFASGLSTEEIARLIDVDPWLVALLRSVLQALDTIEDTSAAKA